MSDLKNNLLKIFGKNSNIIEENPANIVYERF